VALPGRAGSTIRLAPRREPATTAISKVLRMSDRPLSIPEILQRVEHVLGRSLNRASIKASLSEMAASQGHPVRRVSRGRYGSISPKGEHDAA